MLLVGRVNVGWRPREGNLADPHAKRAMHMARSFDWQNGPVNVQEDWLVPLADVAAATLMMHPVRM